jgi:hypothetical protein
VPASQQGEPTLNHWQYNVVALYHLNEAHAGLLLAGTADGAVRVWRNYTAAHSQRLATAWQVSGI